VRAGRYPWPEGEPAEPGTVERIAQAVSGPIGRFSERHPSEQRVPNAPPLAPNHPLVRARRHHQAITLEVGGDSVDLSPSEALRLIHDLEKLAVVLGWLEAR
jgi:hypothetical protein